MELQFYKYQGTGNDFVIIDNRDNAISLTTEQVHKLCDRRFGIGADGLMLLGSKEGYDFEMVYYNADGRESSMCGNGGRCLVKFAYHMGIHKGKYHFIATDGPHDATIEDNQWVHLKMKDVDGIKQHFSDSILNTGSPHYVKPVGGHKLDHFNVFAEGKAIRYNDTYAKEGINVNFVEELPKGIFVRTYERGVEDETLSCGTGVTASALVFAHNDNGFNRVEVKTLGGHLAVEFDKTGEDTFRNIWLCGPAEFVFKGTINI
ncbi:diaminopimelate epimerase [Filimonas lacunae]|uniref:Diaminopimelate epimerase n=1 Tax=Filimonas lacunae TaxID=477680 RepID=A0A173MID0_9BACT|nr:diaminopimelate epimerase [Filimonas lacunae]BAV07181.1 diaminopimelate epimerase [Filimonas lacunae]SIS93673.1 diaminopimelate epimerase [Filimonas lacunae]